MTGPAPVYLYHAVVVRWVDGDTVDLRVDCGFYLWMEGRFRLYGVNTPERGQPGWSEATAFCASMAPPGTHVTASTYKAADKYGRWLANLYVGDEMLNYALVHAGHAKPYMV